MFRECSSGNVADLSPKKDPLRRIKNIQTSTKQNPELHPAKIFLISFLEQPPSQAGLHPRYRRPRQASFEHLVSSTYMMRGNQDSTEHTHMRFYVLQQKLLYEPPNYSAFYFCKTIFFSKVIFQRRRVSVKNILKNTSPINVYQN